MFDLTRMPLKALVAFCEVAKHGSFRIAAEKLFVTPSAISQQIKSLEAAVGVQLLLRDTTNVKLTSSGKQYFADIEQALNAIATATDNLTKKENAANLNVVVPVTFAMQYLFPNMADFIASNPSYPLNLLTPAREVDFQQEDIHAAVYYGNGKWSGLESIFLSEVNLIPVCSPKLHNKIKGQSLKKVISSSDIRLLKVTNKEGSKDWDYWFEQNNIEFNQPERIVNFKFGAHAIEATRNHAGIMLAHLAFIQDDIRNGSLIKLRKKPLLASYAAYLVYPKANKKSAKIKAVAEWMSNIFK